MNLTNYKTRAGNYDPQRVSIMGLPGTGKSSLAAALAAEFNLIWFDLENGKEILFKLPPEHQARINLIHLKDSANFPVAADTMMQLFKYQKGSICHEHGKFGCALCKKDNKPMDDINFTTLTKNDIVVIDSGTQWSHSIFAHILKSKPIDYKPERDDWGALRKHTEFALSQMQAASFNLIVIFHTQEATLEDGKTKLVPIFGSMSMSTEVPKAFGHCIYTDVRNKKHVAYSASLALPNVLTKSRSDFVIEALPTPTLLPIFKGAML